MTNHTPDPNRARRDGILQAALCEQALAHRGRRVVWTSASAALVAVVAGVATWRFLPTGTGTSPNNPLAGSSEDSAIRELMASQPWIPTPEESNRQDSRFRFVQEESPRLIVERVATTPGLAMKYAATPAQSAIARATDDELALALHAVNPSSGLVRVDGQLFAANGGTLVRPDQLPAPARSDDTPQSMLAPRSSAVGV